jgi:hypothetical protein
VVSQQWWWWADCGLSTRDCQASFQLSHNLHVFIAILKTKPKVAELVCTLLNTWQRPLLESSLFTVQQQAASAYLAPHLI